MPLSFSNINTETLTAILVVAFLLLIVGLLVMLLRSAKRANKLTYPIYDYIVKQAEHKAQQITYDAMKKSREMLVNAEIAGTKIIAKDKVESSKIEELYEEKLDELANKTKELLEKYAHEAEENAEKTKSLLEKYAAGAQQSFTALTASLEESVIKAIKDNEQVIRDEAVSVSQKMAATFDSLEKRFKDQIESNIKQEFATAKEVIKTYRREQLALIDTYIVALVERTSAIALQKELSLDEHVKLIHRALEEAKSEGVFK